MKNKKVRVSRTGRRLLYVFIGIIGIIMMSCNVTRVVTNESKYYQKGDTAVTITTKTVESYDATKKTGL